MRVWVLGSGTLIPDSDRGPPAHWVELERSAILMDCGAGTLRTLALLGLDWEALSHVLLTHFHTDHVGGLASLLFALKHGRKRPRETPLTIMGPHGLAAHLKALTHAHGSFIGDPGFPLAIRELSPGDAWEDTNGEFLIHTQSTLHTDHSLAVRLETPDGVVGYTGDTGPDRRLGVFFRGCHLLLAECSHPDGCGTENHLTPNDLASLASEAAPACLVTVHCYPSLEPERVPTLLADHGYGGWVLAGRDGLGMDLRAGTVELVGAMAP